MVYVCQHEYVCLHSYMKLTSTLRCHKSVTNDETGIELDNDLQCVHPKLPTQWLSITLGRTQGGARAPRAPPLDTPLYTCILPCL